MKNKQSYYKDLAKSILSLVGGKRNVDKLIHCVTRLRFYLKDDSKPDKKSLEELSGVMGIIEANNQFQVVVGQEVEDIYDELSKLLPDEKEDFSTESENKDKFSISTEKTFFGKLRYKFNRLIGIITGSVMPIIQILAAAGIIKSIMAVGTSLNLFTDTSNIYLIINAMSDAVFYFLPIFIGYNAAKRLGVDPILTAVIGGVIMYPSILDAANNDSLILSIGSLNFPFVAYTYSIFPMILAAWLVKVITPKVKEWLPAYIRSLFTPVIVIAFVSSIIFLLAGPVITWLSHGLANQLQALLSWNGAIFGGIIGGFYQILVIFGLHWGFIPIYINDFAVLGYSYLSAIVSFPAVGQAGAALAVAVKSKKSNIKELGYSGTLSAFAGITEPAIYGVNLRFKRPFICASIGSGIGGFLAGLLRVNMWNIVGSIIGLPSYIDPEKGINSNFWYAVIITIITLVVSFILTYIWGYNDNMKMHEKREQPKNPGKVTSNNY